MFVIIKKEIRAYFTSFTGYIFLAGFLFLLSIFFIDNNLNNFNSDFVQTLALVNTLHIFLIIIPLITMQLFSDEHKFKTDMLLFSSRISISHIVLGKYFGAFILYTIGLFLSISFPIYLSFFGNIDIPVLISIYIGYILMGSAFISICLFISCISKNYVISAIASFVSLYFFFVIDNIAQSMPSDRISSFIFFIFLALIFSYTIYDATRSLIIAIIALIAITISISILFFINPYLFDSALPMALSYISLLRRLGEFGIGILSISNILFYISFSSVFIYLTINTIEKRRWR